MILIVDSLYIQSMFPFSHSAYDDVLQGALPRRHGLCNHERTQRNRRYAGDTKSLREIGEKLTEGSRLRSYSLRPRWHPRADRAGVSARTRGVRSSIGRLSAAVTSRERRDFLSAPAVPPSARLDSS
jgi:hypothetical protein